jgi:hypothetical protein
MGDADTEMQRWCDEALVVIQSLLDAAATALEGAGRDANGDEVGSSTGGSELPEAVHHAERWKSMHPCPDSQLGEELAHLLATWATMVAEDDPDGAPEDQGGPAPVDPQQRREQMRTLTGDTVRFQSQLDTELLPGQ